MRRPGLSVQKNSTQHWPGFGVPPFSTHAPSHPVPIHPHLYYDNPLLTPLNKDVVVPDQKRIVAPGKKNREVITDTGEGLRPPLSWALLPPGDATLTRRIKAAGPHWQVQEKKGRKKFPKGVWAPLRTIEAEQARRRAEKQDPAYVRRLAAGRARRRKQEAAYGDEFRRAIFQWLNFPAVHGPLARELSQAIAHHALPVGSGTVARTRRISVEERARAAVIAWMRHHTTNYDSMAIPRIKGERRRVRRKLAQDAVALLARYRRGESPDPCPLRQGLVRARAGQ